MILSDSNEYSDKGKENDGALEIFNGERCFLTKCNHFWGNQRVSTTRHRHTMGFRLVRKGQRMLCISETVARCYEVYIYIIKKFKNRIEFGEIERLRMMWCRGYDQLWTSCKRTVMVLRSIKIIYGGNTNAKKSYRTCRV